MSRKANYGVLLETNPIMCVPFVLDESSLHKILMNCDYRVYSSHVLCAVNSTLPVR